MQSRIATTGIIFLTIGVLFGIVWYTGAPTATAQTPRSQDADLVVSVDSFKPPLSHQR